MRLRAVFGVVALLLAPVFASAHVIRWTATMLSDQSGETATVRLRVRDACRAVLQTPLGAEFVCPGRWRCGGTACPARRGRLTFRRGEESLAARDVELVWRHGACSAHFVGVGGSDRAAPPFSWTYACFRGSPARESDSGTFDLDLAR